MGGALHLSATLSVGDSEACGDHARSHLRIAVPVHYSRQANDPRSHAGLHIEPTRPGRLLMILPRPGRGGQPNRPGLCCALLAGARARAVSSAPPGHAGYARLGHRTGLGPRRATARSPRGASLAPEGFLQDAGGAHQRRSRGMTPGPQRPCAANGGAEALGQARQRRLQGTRHEGPTTPRALRCRASGDQRQRYDQQHACRDE